MSERLRLAKTPIDGLLVMQRIPAGDARGELERLYCLHELAPALKGARVEQVNRTLTRGRGTVRGLHFQRPPHAEDKVVACLRGEVFDVAVDVRAGSPTYLRWHAEVLSPSNRRSMVIPKGFAHGFQALTDDCEMLYLHTAAYEPAAESGIDATDPDLGIAWPLPVADRSDRDRGLPRVASGFRGITP